MLRNVMICAALATLATPSFAGPVSSGELLRAAPLSDLALSAVRGTAAPTSFNRASMRAFGERQAHDDELFIGAIGRIQMDNWWSSAGSELIAISLRQAQ